MDVDIEDVTPLKHIYRDFAIATKYDFMFMKDLPMTSLKQDCILAIDTAEETVFGEQWIMKVCCNNNVEWLFAFDVHCNSFVPLFVALYLGQLILSPLLSQRGFICALLSNILYGLSLSYYHYCQFVGFNSLPFLERTEFLLYPVVGLVLLAIPLSAMQFNPTRWVLSWYFGPVIFTSKRRGRRST